MSDKRLIHAAMVQATRDIGAVGKDGKNTFQKYKFRSVDAVMAAVQNVLGKNNIHMDINSLEHETVPTGSKGYMSTVKVAYTFVHGEDHSAVRAVYYGQGADNGDKALYKAYAGALKYAMTQIFMIPTEELKDAEDDSPEILHIDQGAAAKFAVALQAVDNKTALKKAEAAYGALDTGLQNHLYTEMSAARERVK